MFSRRDASNAALIKELEDICRDERRRIPDFLACLSEAERRRMHLDFAYPTLFDFCVSHLKLSEGNAAVRIQSARAADRFPALYVLIRDGDLSLTAVSRLAPHLTAENFDSVVVRATAKRQRDIEALIVEIVDEKRRREAAAMEPPPLSPVPEPSLFEAPPSEKPMVPPEPERRRDVVRIEAPGLVRFSFQADEGLRQRLEAARALLRRSCPSGRLEDVVRYIVDDFLNRRDPCRKAAAPERPPRARETRRIPRWVRDRVWRRDEGRCAFISPDGRRCAARSGLEFDHVKPWALGGGSDDPRNVRLLCRAHNLLLARRTFGYFTPSTPG